MESIIKVKCEGLCYIKNMNYRDYYKSVMYYANKWINKWATEKINKSIILWWSRCCFYDKLI